MVEYKPKILNILLLFLLKASGCQKRDTDSTNKHGQTHRRRQENKRHNGNTTKQNKLLEAE